MNRVLTAPAFLVLFVALLAAGADSQTEPTAKGTDRAGPTVGSRMTREEAIPRLKAAGFVVRPANAPGVDISTTGASPEAGKALAVLPAIPDVYSLRLDIATLTDADLAPSNELKTLRVLTISSSAWNGSGLKNIQNLTELLSLRVGGAAVAGEAITHLRRLGALEQLSLRGTKAGDGAMATVGTLLHLRELRLTDTRVSDEGLAHLGGLARLRKLDLDGTRITARALNTFGQ